MPHELRVKIETLANLDVQGPLDLLVRKLAELVPDFCGDEQVLNDVELAFHEAFTNIHKHAYGGLSEGLVIIEVTVSPDRIEIRLEDEGKGFDPDKVPVPDFDTPCEGGLGVWLMRTLMNEFRYYVDAKGRNVLHLVKHCHPKRQTKDR